MVNCSLFSFLYFLSPKQDCVLPTLGQGILPRNRHVSYIVLTLPLDYWEWMILV